MDNNQRLRLKNLCFLKLNSRSLVTSTDQPLHVSIQYPTLSHFSFSLSQDRVTKSSKCFLFLFSVIFLLPLHLPLPPGSTSPSPSDGILLRSTYCSSPTPHASLDDLDLRSYALRLEEKRDQRETSFMRWSFTT